MTEKIRKAYHLNPPRGNKYHAKRTDGYASKKEANRVAELRILEQAGKIWGLKLQVRFELLPAIPGYRRPLVYIADATYYTFDDKSVVGCNPITRDLMGTAFVILDVKGVRTKEYKIKKRLMRQLLGLEITEV